MMRLQSFPNGDSGQFWRLVYTGGQSPMVIEVPGMPYSWDTAPEARANLSTVGIRVDMNPQGNYFPAYRG